MRKETNPIAYYSEGRLDLRDFGNMEAWITCIPYGQMSDGTMVWEDNEGNQYTRNKFFGKYFWVEL